MSWNPPLLTESTAATVRETIDELEDYLTPASRAYIGQKVATLLSHYFVADAGVDHQAAIGSDWIEDLEDFPEWAIDEACLTWRRGDRRKPTPGDIRTLARQAVEPQQMQFNILSHALYPPLSQRGGDWQQLNTLPKLAQAHG